jgi:hypothetical protein
MMCSVSGSRATGGILGRHVSEVPRSTSVGWVRRIRPAKRRPPSRRFISRAAGRRGSGCSSGGAVSAPGVVESDVARSIGEFVDLDVPPSPAMNPVSEGERQHPSGSDQRPGSVRDFLTS